MRSAHQPGTRTGPATTDRRTLEDVPPAVRLSEAGAVRGETVVTL